MADIKGKPLAYVVDDDADIREVVRLAMVFEGWDVRVAGGGQEALGYLRERLPDLLIIDLMMPGMSGMELLRTLIGRGGADELPVLMISAVREGARLVDDFRELPFARKQFIHKPFNNEEMLRAIRTLVPGDFRAKAAPTKPATAKPAPQPQAVRTAPPTNHIRGYRMLVVDDEPDICFVMKTHLGLYHQVRTASNGIEGLEVLDEFEPDFVLTDVNMPQMNGLQFAESIRRHPRLGATPIFFFTGESDTSLPRRSYDVGGNLFLRKPIDVEQLLKFIDHFIQETGLRPGERPAAAKPGAKPTAPPKPTAPATAKTLNAVRILTVSQSPEDRLLIAPVLAKIPAVETLWTDDPFSAIGNLTRWDPDVVLYNVRHPRMEGVEFGQTLTLKRVEQRPLVCFIGSGFSALEIDYSRRNFAYDPITVNASERLQGRLTALIDAARPRIRPKRMEIAAIQKEEADRLQVMQDESDRKKRQQDALRGRYDQLQKFIDSNFK